MINDLRQPGVDKTLEFEQYRSYLFSIAYRMLGSVMDAEDMVQETFLRWQKADADRVHSTKHYLSKTVVNLSIDHLRTVQTEREAYPGMWLPEPIINSQPQAMIESLMQSESVSTAFLMLLETLTPLERAVYLLRYVFDYEHAEIAAIVNKSEANCRQIAHRAHDNISQKRPRFPVSAEEHEHITRQFIEMCANGDVAGLIALLADEAILYSDGGGKVKAAMRPVFGAEKIARFVFGVLRTSLPNLRFDVRSVNGRTGIVLYIEGRLEQVMTFSIGDHRIQGMFVARNPDKLRDVPPLEV
jgi:RNA polymerase sigma-70 factor (ECF subfamily)